MKKHTANTDVSNLFNKFGGDAKNYQEIQHGYHIEKAHKSWPIVSAMENSRIKSPQRKSASISTDTDTAKSFLLSHSKKTEFSPTDTAAPTGGFDLKSGGTELRSLTAINQRLSVQFKKDDPLILVFSRLMGQNLPVHP